MTYSQFVELRKGIQNTQAAISTALIFPAYTNLEVPTDIAVRPIYSD